MPQSLTNLIMHLKPYWLDSASAALGIELNKIILFPSATDPAVFYSKTAAGLLAALAASTSGQVVQINGPVTITGSYTIPAGVMLRALSRFETVIVGTISTGSGSSVFNLGIAATANNANPLYGLTGPSTGAAYALNCDISATQSGAGNAYAIGAVNGSGIGSGNIYAENCYLSGSSVGGSGYAGRATAGMIYSKWNDYNFSTDRWVMV